MQVGCGCSLCADILVNSLWSRPDKNLPRSECCLGEWDRARDREWQSSCRDRAERTRRFPPS